MTKNNVVKEKKGVATEEKAVKKNITLTFEQSMAWRAYRGAQIQSLIADALSRDMDDITIKRLVPLAIARQIDQMHNSAERKISAYEAGTQLVLDDLFSDAGRTTAKAVAYERAMDLFLDAAAVDKDAAKAILRNAKKIDTSESWEHAVFELESIIG